MRSLRNERFNILACLFYLSFSSFCLRKVIFEQGVLSGYDWAIPPSRDAIARVWASYLYLWNKAALNFAGASLSQGARVVINWWTLLFALTRLGLDGSLISKAMVVGLFAAAGVTSYAMLRYIGTGKVSSLLGGWVYMTAPIVYDLILLSGLGALIGYVILPIAFVLFLASRKSPRRWLKCCIVCSVLLLIYPLHVLFIATGLFTLFAVCDMLLQRDSTRFLQDLRFIAVMGVVSLLLQSYWTVPTVLGMFQEIAALPFAAWGASRQSPMEIVRIQGFFLPAFEVDFLDGMMSILGSFVLPVLALMGLILFPRRTVSCFASIAALSVLLGTSLGFVQAAIQMNLGGIAFAFRNLTVLFSILAFAYVILFSQVLDLLLRIRKEHSQFSVDTRLPLRGRRCVWKLALLLVLIVPYGWYVNPFYATGDFDGRLHTMTFPGYYQHAFQWIDEKAGNSKTLWLPMGVGYVHDTWQPEVWSHSDFATYSTMASGPPIDVNSRYQFPMQTWFENLLYSGESNQLGQILGLYGVRYIAVRNDTEISNWAAPHNDLLVTLRKTSMIIETLKKQDDIRPVATFGNITIYENTESLPLIYGVPSLMLTTGDLSTLEETVRDNTVDFRRTTIAFAAQQSDPAIVRLAGSVGVTEGTIADLLVPYLPQESIHDPGSVSLAQSATDGWVDMHQWYWWYDTTSQAALERAAMAFGSINSPMSLSVTVPAKGGTYVLLVKALFLEPDRGFVKVGWDDNTAGIIRAQPDACGRYNWFAVSNFRVSAGDHILRLVTNTKVAIARILVIPEEVIERSLDDLANVLGIASNHDIGDMLGMHGTFINRSRQSSAIQTVTFDSVAPTKYLVHVTTDGPFFLVFSENFHASWRAIVDGMEVPHFQVNGFANGWYVKKAGHFDMTLEFAGQENYQDLMTLSLLALIVCLAYVVIPDKIARARALPRSSEEH